MSKQKIFSWSITVALAGFLFGFDTAVISGADQPIQNLWNTSPLFHGAFIMSMALWGTVFGALFGGIPCDRFGRKKTLIWIGVLYLISALGSAIAPEPFTFAFFRFIGGLGVGASSVAAPIYISEIAPAERRGQLVALYQFNIVFGILIAFLSNFLVGQWLGTDNWRLMLGIEALPAAAYLLMVLRVPNSPRWLILRKGDESTAKRLLQTLNPGKSVDQLIKEIKGSVVNKTQDVFFSAKFFFPILLAFLLAFFNQLSGINFVLYYAPRLFKAAGLADSASLLSSVGLGVVNLIFTLLGMYLIDRTGRRKLMLYGSVGYILTLLGVAWAFYTEAGGLPVVFFICGFIASHAIGQGAVIWVFISEIFPNTVRANGMSLGSGTHWVFAALITLVTLFFMNLFGNQPWPLFAFFAFMMVLQLLFVIFIMPETKGVPLEELQEKLNRTSKKSIP